MATLNTILKLKQYYYKTGRAQLYSSIQYDLISAAATQDLTKSTITQNALLFDTLRQMVPYETGHPLLRLGGTKDGAYLVPNDLEGISDCFSPGVNTYKRFEDDLCARGIRCHMCDGRVTMDIVETPLLPGGAQTFRNKWLDIETNENSITLSDWVESEAPTKGDLILQMDIEGAEYRVLLDLHESLLARFRIIILELHFLDWAVFDLAFLNNALAPMLSKISQFFLPVHFHPNNVTGALRIAPGVYIPKIAELTFLRKDRIKNWPTQRPLPHSLDVKNVPSKPPLRLRIPWEISAQNHDQDLCLRTFCANSRIDYQRCHQDFLRNGCHPKHKLSIENFDSQSEELSLMINPVGRFGNGIRQLFIAFAVAQVSGIHKVFLGDFLLHNTYSIHLKGNPKTIEFPLRAPGILFSSELLSPDITNVISGPFINPLCFPLLSSLPVNFETLLGDFATHVLQPLLGFTQYDCNIDDTCAVHIRSGDIFSASKPNPWYGQPPLSYYKYATAYMATNFSPSEFVVTYEDLGNPVIEPYIKWLDAQGISYRTSSATFGEDFSQLVRSKYLISSKGSLSPAVALVSCGKSCIICYEAFDSKGMPFDSFSNFHILKVSHAEKSYLKPGLWKNSPEQRQLMITFDPKYNLLTKKTYAK